MGCGASSHERDPARATQKEQTASGTSRYAAPADGDEEAHDDGESYGNGEAELTEEELKLLAEMDRQSAGSTAESADEPGSFTANVRVQLRVMKARVLHGIDGSCEDATPAPTPTASEVPLVTSGDGAGRFPFGDLKPRQVRKIADWVQKVLRANADGYETVPERLRRQRRCTGDGSDSASAASGAQDLCSPRSVASTSYPATPTMGGSPRLRPGFSPGAGSPRRDGVENMNVSGSDGPDLSTSASGILGGPRPMSDVSGGGGGGYTRDGGDDDDNGPALDDEHLRRHQQLDHTTTKQKQRGNASADEKPATA